ncbi:MAG: protein kinase [Chloroflexota bacterium]
MRQARRRPGGGPAVVYDRGGRGPRRVEALDRPNARSIGPYDLLEPLGKGGMGEVYRARHRELQQDRAIKVLPPHLAADESFVARFKREALIAAGLRHPNVVLIYDVGEQDGYHYIVMELVQGRSLREVIHADRPLSFQRAIDLLRPLAQALDFAHQRGVVHRDVKPSNIIVGADDHVTLLDFGIARAVESSQQLTREGLIVGTPEYIAPEVVMGGEVGASADLYSLGIVAYEMLTGHVPFRGANTTAVAFAHVHTAPPSPRADRADLPPSMERVLLRQLAKNPADRYPNARSFVDALEAGPTADEDADEDAPTMMATRTDVEAITRVARLDEDVTPRPFPATPSPQPAAPSPRPSPLPSPSSLTTPQIQTPDQPRTEVALPTASATGLPGRPAIPGAPGAGAGGPDGSARRKRGLPILATVATVLVLVVLGGYGLFQWRGGQVTPTPTAIAQATGAPATVAPAVTAPATSAPQATIAANPSPGSPLDAARAAMAAGDFPRAVTLLTEAKRANPSTPGLDDLLFQAQIGQGQALLQKGDAENAAAAFGEALKLRPNDPQALDGQRKAKVAGLKKQAEASAGRDDEAAISAYEQLLQLTPDDADAKGRLYGLLIAKADRLFDSDAAQARTALARAAEIDANRPEARDRLARFAISPASAERVKEIARWGKGTAGRLVYGPEGKLLAVASSYGVYLYDGASHAEVRFLETGAFVWDAAFSPDGQEVAAAVNDGTVRVWSVADGAPIRSLTGHDGPVLSVMYSPTYQWLLTGSADKTARIWNRADGSAVRTLTGHTEAVRDVAFSPDGQKIVTGSADKTARVWGAVDGALQATLRGHEDEVTSVTFAPDGQSVATGAQDNTVRIWRTADGGLVRTLTGHSGWVLDVAFAPDGQALISAGDNTARLWRTTDGTMIRTLQGHTNLVMAATVSKEHGVVATASRDGTVRFWRLQDGAPAGAIETLSSLVRGVAISPDGQTVAAGLDSGAILLLKASDLSPIRTLTGHTDSVYGVAFSPDGQLLASGSDDKSVRLWKVADGSVVRTMNGHTDWVRVVRFGDNGQTVFSGSADKTVRFWRVSDGANTRTLTEHEWGVSALAVAPQGGILATGTADKPIRLFQTGDRSPPKVLNGHTDWVNGLAISADGQTLASASTDKTIRLWRLPDGSPIRTLQGHDDVVESVAFSQNGQLLVSASWDRTVRLWRAGDGGLVRTLTGHTSAVNGVVMSSDGQLVVSGSSDGTVRVWGVR